MESTHGWESRTAVLTRADNVARDVFRYELTLDPPLPFRPGQFVNLAIPAEKKAERSYSVYSDPVDPARLVLVIKLFEGGLASEYLRRASIGDVLHLRGPFGVFTLTEDDGPVWFVATVTGVAPFHSMLCSAARRADPRPFRLYFGVRDQGDLFGIEDLERLRAALPDFRYEVCLSRPEPGWSGPVGRVTRLLDEHHPAPRDHYYLCGNGSMIEEARDLLKARGLDRKRIHYEKYY